MKFSDLLQIVDHLVEHVTCPNCKAHYHADQLGLMGVTPDEVLFYTTCEKCDTQVLINVTLAAETDEIQDWAEKLSIQTQLAPRISQDDFLDVKNSLKNFDGDFKALFS